MSFISHTVLDLLRLALLNEVGHGHFIPDISGGKRFIEKLLAFAM